MSQLLKALQIQAMLEIPTESELGIDDVATLIAPEKAGTDKESDRNVSRSGQKSSSTPALFRVFSVYIVFVRCVWMSVCCQGKVAL